MLQTKAKCRALAKEAARLGICAPWLERLRGGDLSDKELCRMFADGICFCLNHNFPSRAFIRGQIDPKERRQAGIYIDEGLDVAGRRRVVALGRSTGVVRLSGRDVAAVYCSDDSEITITAAGDSFFIVDILCSARVAVRLSGRAGGVVNIYTGGSLTDATNTGTGRLKISEKGRPNYIKTATE